MNKLLTIIIPVYRVSDTIDRCIESIVAQGYDNMEIILVDDGSPDDCPAICDRWAQCDNRIIVIHKSNGGLSDARNTGLNAANGGFVTFVDSDDFVGPDTYKTLMDIMLSHPEYDILEFPVFRFYGSSKQSILKFHDKTYNNITSYWMEEKAYEHSYAWNKIYRRRLFDNVRFPTGLVFEDIYTLPKLLEHTGIVATTSKGLYYYCNNNNGITATATGKELKMLLNAHLNVLDKYSVHPLFHLYYMHVVNIQISEYELTEEQPLLKPVTITNLRGLSITSKLKAIVINLLGIKGLCILSKSIKRITEHH